MKTTSGASVEPYAAVAITQRGGDRRVVEETELRIVAIVVTREVVVIGLVAKVQVVVVCV